MPNNWQEKHYLRSLLALLVLTALAYAFWWFMRQRVDTSVAVEAPIARAIAKVEQVDTPVAGGQVRTFKPAAKVKAKLPPAVIANPDQQVTGATTVKPTERPVTVTSVIDTKTGETTTFSKPDPYPWLAVESRGEVRFDYGYKASRGKPIPMPVGRLSVVHDFVQVKGFHAGVNGALDTDGTTFVGVGVGYRW